MPSSMPACARPVRTFVRSLRSGSMAFSIPAFSSLKTSSSMAPHFLASAYSPSLETHGGSGSLLVMRDLDWKSFDVLVVDDEEDNLDAFRFAFRKSFSLH